MRLQRDHHTPPTFSITLVAPVAPQTMGFMLISCGVVGTRKKI